jgi:hypothetical protein
MGSLEKIIRVEIKRPREYRGDFFKIIREFYFLALYLKKARK